MMEVTFLGTGNAFSHHYRNTNLWIRWEHSNLLVDCGTQCPISLQNLAISPKEIRNIFISHLHADHVGGLEEILLQCKYHFHTLPNLYIPNKLQHSLWENSLKAGLENTTDQLVGLDYYANPIFVQEKFDVDGVTFEMVATNHIKGLPSYGLYFHNIFYTGDTVFDPKQIFLMLERAKIIIHDCSFSKNPVHAHYEELLTLPVYVRHRIFLVHYNDGCEEKLQYMAQQGFRYVKPYQTLYLV